MRKKRGFLPLKFYCMRVQQSDLSRLESISCIIGFDRKKILSARVWTKIDGDRNNPRISSATVTNFQLTLASAEENFPILNDLLDPVEPEVLTFFMCSSFLSRNQHGVERSLAATKVGHRLAFCCIWNIDKWHIHFC